MTKYSTLFHLFSNGQAFTRAATVTHHVTTVPQDHTTLNSASPPAQRVPKASIAQYVTEYLSSTSFTVEHIFHAVHVPTQYNNTKPYYVCCVVLNLQIPVP